MKTIEVSQHCEGPSGLGHRWCSACSLEPEVSPALPLRCGNLPYSSSFSSMMGTAGRIRAAWCRLPAAFWSTKVFWSGIVSVVSWVWDGGQQESAARSEFGGEAFSFGTHHFFFFLNNSPWLPIHLLVTGPHPIEAPSTRPPSQPPPCPKLPLSSTGSALWTCLASVRAPGGEKGDSGHARAHRAAPQVARDLCYTLHYFLILQPEAASMHSAPGPRPAANPPM